ncbi:hypothetical protein D3C78_1094150 [compost metagenome]
MVLLSIFTLGMGRLLEIQTTRAKRFQEEELLWAGEQYRAAIGKYYEASPGAVRQLPGSIDDLLEDPRLLTLTRHLRAAYPDPVTKKAFEEIHDASGNLIGVRSRSRQRPIKSANFPAHYKGFEHAETYNDWEFIFLP